MALPYTPFKLTPEQTKDLRDAQEILGFMEKEIQRATEAGLPVAEWQKKWREAKNTVDGMLRVYI